MEKLLARIRAFFAPPQAPAPPEVVREVNVTASPPAAPVEREETAEPIVTAVEIPAVEPDPEPAPALVVAPPGPIEEATEEPSSDLEPTIADGLTLQLQTERGSPATFQVTRSGATIGRGPESTIQLADLSVSRKHARIAYRQGAYWLSDLGSMGGTWVNGAKLAAPRRVATGQTIDIGLCRLVVVGAAEGEKTGAVKGPSNAA